MCHIGKNESKAKLVSKPFISRRRDFEFDYSEKVVYSYEDERLEELRLKDRVTNILYTYPAVAISYGGGVIRSISLDWTKKKLYVYFANSLQVFDVAEKSPTPKTLIHFDERFFIPKIKVFPNAGYLVVKTYGK